MHDQLVGVLIEEGVLQIRPRYLNDFVIRALIQSFIDKGEFNFNLDVSAMLVDVPSLGAGLHSTVFLKRVRKGLTSHSGLNVRSVLQHMLNPLGVGLINCVLIGRYILSENTRQRSAEQDC
jgi:hypothetical protein